MLRLLIDASGPKQTLPEPHRCCGAARQKRRSQYEAYSGELKVEEHSRQLFMVVESEQECFLENTEQAQNFAPVAFVILILILMVLSPFFYLRLRRAKKKKLATAEKLSRDNV